jgi:hypothetical protein
MHGVGRTVTIAQDARIDLLDALDVDVDLLDRSSLRWSSRKEGSPTIEVPPPISVIGRWPVSCNQ